MAKRKSKKNKLKILKNQGFPVVLLVLLLAAVGLVFAPLDAGLLSGHHLLFKSLLASVLPGLMMLWWLWHNKKQPLVLSSKPLAKHGFFLLWLLGLISIIWSVNIDFTLDKWIRWSGAGLVLMLASQVLQNPTNLQKLAWGIFGLGVLMSLIGIGQYFSLITAIDQAISPAITFSNKNFGAHPIVLMLPLGFYLLIKTQTWQHYSVVSLGIVLMVAYIFYTQTRAAWLALSLEFILMLIYVFITRTDLASYWHKGKTLAVAISLVVLALLLNLDSSGQWSSVWTTMSEKIDTTMAVGGDSGRFNIWSLAYQMWLDKPILGSGLGSFFDNMANGGYESYNTKGTQKVHNDLIELVVDLGVIGLLIFIAMVAGLLRGFITKLQLNQPWSPEQVFYVGVLAALSGSFVNMMFSSPYQHDYPLLIFGLYSGILLANPVLTSDKKIIILPAFSRYLLMLLVSILICVGFLLNQSIIKTYNKSTDYIVDISKGVVKPVALTPWINTPSFSTSRRSFLEGLFDNGKYQATIYMAQEILSHWKNNHTALFRASIANFYLGDYQQANLYSERLIAISPPGDYRGQLNKMAMLTKQNNARGVYDMFIELSQKPEHLLAKRAETYQQLFVIALNLSQPEAKIVSLYQAYNRHHPKNLKLEKTLRDYYLRKNKK